MIRKFKKGYQTIVVLVLVITICYTPFVTANENNMNSTLPSQNTTNYTTPESPAESIPVSSETEIAQNITNLQTITPSFSMNISPTPTITDERLPPPNALLSTDLIVINETPNILQLNVSDSTNASKYNSIEESVDRQIMQIEDHKKTRSKSQKKLTDDLLILIDDTYPIKIQTPAQIKTRMKKANQLVSSEDAIINFGIRNQDQKTLGDQVKVEIYLKPFFTTQIVNPYVTNITGRDEEWHLVVAWVDVNKLDQLASLDGVSAIRQVEPAEHSAGSVITEGYSLHQVNYVTNTYGYTGNNVKIGAISDGVNDYSNAVSSQDLPATFDSAHILSSSTGWEGVPMLEVVHDLAPGSELFFHESDTTDPLEYNQAVDDLIDAGSSIIVDDTILFTQPYFEDGIVASHIKQELVDHPNLVFITAAGNNAQRHFQGTFKDQGNHFHDFSNEPNPVTKNVYFDLNPYDSQNPKKCTVRIILQWNDQWGNSNNDYDLYLIDRNTGEIIASSTSYQSGLGDYPIEVITYQNSGSTNKNLEIRVKNAGGLAEAKTLELFVFDGIPHIPYPEYSRLQTDSIFGYQAVRDVITVGAIPSGEREGGINDIYAYSQRGPVTISYPIPDSRQKPDICGITDVSVSSAVGLNCPAVVISGSNYYFTGTSAAAPHIAGIIALARQANPSLTRSQIKYYLTSSAVDLGDTGWDSAYGYGRANAQTMIQNILADGSEATQYVTITSIAGPHGSISPSSASGEVRAHKGTSPTFTISPDLGYSISEIRVNQQVVGSGSSYTFSNVQTDGIITASFIVSTTPTTTVPTTTPTIPPDTAPSAAYMSDVIAGNAPLSVQFKDTSTGNPTVWNWSFGDDNSWFNTTNPALKNPSHLFNSIGTFKVNLTASNSLGSSKVTRQISVINTAPPTDISTMEYASSGAYIVPAEIYSINFTEIGAGGGGGGGTFNPAYSTGNGGYGGNAGQKIVNSTLTVIPGNTIPILIGEYGIGGDGSYGATDGHSGQPGGQTSVGINIVVGGSGGNGGVWSSTISHWDGFPGQDGYGTGQYATSGTTTGSYIGGSGGIGRGAGGGGASGTSVGVGGSGAGGYVKIYPLVPPHPLAEFMASPTSGSTPLTVTFNDTSSNSPTSWYWMFGDGNFSNDRNVSWTYNSSGVYSINHSATNIGGTDWINRTNYINVTVPPAPVANFTATPTTGLFPLTVVFTDTSTENPTSWNWDFGDGDTTNSSEQNPVHTYHNLGYYSVTLTASNEYGNNTSTKTNFIWVPAIEYPYGNATAWGTTFGNTPDRAFDHDSTTIWSGKPNSWIKMDYGPGVSHVINQFNMAPSLGSPNTVRITASTDDNFWTSLYTESNVVWTGDNQLFTFPNNNSYRYYRLWITSTGGGYYGFSELGLLYNGSTLPPEFSATPSSGIAPLTVAFVDNSPNPADTWSWDFGDGNSTDASVQNPVHTFWRSGSYTVTLTISNSTSGISSVTRPDYIKVRTISPPISQWTDTSGPYTIVTFNGSGTASWTTPQDVDSVDYLVVGGGGGGGGTLSGGGGGAGGMLTGSGYPVNQSEVYAVSVGSGGSGGGVVPPFDPGQAGVNGGNSSFDTIIAIGGGGGGVQIGTTTGKNGGSGGGGSNMDPGGSGIPGQGSSGGIGYGTTSASTGGGGGAGSSGSDGTSTEGGAGGNGLASSITGSSIFYAGGGGGVTYLRTVPGTGGAGGGGSGAGTMSAVNGTNDLGGGGGGGSYTGLNYLPGADGGSGVVIIRYLTQPITANFTSNTTVGQFPLAVQFTDSSYGNPDEWNWSFGDGNTTNATVQNPVHMYWTPGIYTVNLSVANTTKGFSNTTTMIQYINVTNIPPPVANFTASPVSGLMPLHVQFNDTSSGNPTNWSWNFGDGGTSAARNPLYTYNASGTYMVNLTASNPGGNGTLSRAGFISVTPSIIPGIQSISPASGSNTTSVSITNLSGTNFTAGTGFMLTPVNPVPEHKGSINHYQAALRRPFSVFVSGNYSYVASATSNALEIVDVSNPASPTHKGSLTNGAGGASLSVPSGVFVSGNYAYVSSSGSYALEIVNVTNPASPTHAGRILDGAGGALLGYPRSVFVSGNYAYVASALSNALEIVDVTNPANPVHKGSIVNGTGGALLAYPVSVYVSGNYAYVTSYNSKSLEIIDISNPASPVHKGSIVNGTGGALLTNPNCVFVSGNYAYIASTGSNALEVVDVSNPASPTHKGSIVNGAGGAVLNSPMGVYTSGNLAYVASTNSNALEIVDVSNPASPIHKASIANGAGGAILATPMAVYVSGPHAFVVGGTTTSGALEIIKTGTVPASSITLISPTKITGTLNLPGTVAGPYNVVIVNPYGHIATLANGFTVTT